jgi:hypothetical protein
MAYPAWSTFTYLTGKSPFLMGKSTISMAMFNNKLLVYQRVFSGFTTSTTGPIG